MVKTLTTSTEYAYMVNICIYYICIIYHICIYCKHLYILYILCIIYHNISYIWTHGEEKLALFLNDLNNCHSNIKFTHESNKEHIPFLDLKY